MGRGYAVLLHNKTIRKTTRNTTWARRSLTVVLLLAVFLSGSGCGSTHRSSEGWRSADTPNSAPQETAALSESKQLQQEIEKNPENSAAIIQSVTDAWLYGPGVGKTLLNVGGIIIYPPFALYVLSQAAMEVSGYPAVGVTDLLPPREKEGYKTVYETVAGAPGRISASIAGKEFRSPEVVRARLQRTLKKE